MELVQRCPKRISGPLRERIDVDLEVEQVSFQKLAALDKGETSATIRQRVEQARKL